MNGTLVGAAVRIVDVPQVPYIAVVVVRQVFRCLQLRLIIGAGVMTLVYIWVSDRPLGCSIGQLHNKRIY